MSPQSSPPSPLPSLPSSALAATVWRADGLARQETPGLPSGFASLDAQLPGGGWPPGALTELIARDPGVGELRLLVPLLRRLTHEHRPTLLLSPPHLPYAPALVAHGVRLDRLIVVQAGDAAERLWAAELALKSAALGALLAWLPPGPARPDRLRRLQLAAAGMSGPVFLLRPLPAQFEASPAPLRLLLEPRGEERLSVRILKRRGPPPAAPLLLDLPRPAGAVALRARRLESASPSAAAARVEAMAAGGARPSADASAPGDPRLFGSGTPGAAMATDAAADAPTDDAALPARASLATLMAAHPLLSGAARSAPR